MKWLITAGEYLVGLLILIVTLFCIVLAGFASLFELPRYLRRMQK